MSEPCAQNVDVLVDYAVGGDDALTPRLKEHLATCKGCSEHVDRIRQREKALLDFGALATIDPGPEDDAVLARIRGGVLRMLEAPAPIEEPGALETSDGVAAERPNPRIRIAVVAAATFVLLIVLVALIVKGRSLEEPVPQPFEPVMVANYVPELNGGGRSPASLSGSETTEAVFSLADSKLALFAEADVEMINSLQRETRNQAKRWKEAVERADWFAATVAAERLRRAVAVEALGVAFADSREKPSREGCLSAVAKAALEPAASTPQSPGAQRALQAARAGRLREAAFQWNTLFRGISREEAIASGMTAEEARELRRKLEVMCPME